jgi:hypothetical protein
MRPLFLARLALAVPLAVAFLAAAPARAADGVKFDTIDGVELHGTYYPGSKGNKSPCALLLHNIGSKSQDDDWDRLATELQKVGFAVLSFDFRGHGNSTSVAPETFWKDPVNRRGIKGGLSTTQPKDSINFKDFQKYYHPVLANDVAAAKLFLDRRNDEGQCNSRSLILIGAQEGAAIGALWLASDMYRYQLISKFPLKWDPNPEGKNVIACVWLSMTGSQAGVPGWLRVIGKDKKIPMAFIYGADDPQYANFAQKWAKDLKGEDKITKACTAEKGIPKTKLQGGKLLRKDLAAQTIEKGVVSYATFVLEKVTPPDWSQQEVEKRGYVWAIPGRRPITAKLEGEKYMHLIPLDAFVGLR